MTSQTKMDELNAELARSRPMTMVEAEVAFARMGESIRRATPTIRQLFARVEEWNARQVRRVHGPAKSAHTRRYRRK